VAGTRIPVAAIVRMVAAGMKGDSILEDYPQLGAGIQGRLRVATANLDQRGPG
jgi:uncharacterized protein (DUF433 family)